nr:MAG TPA: hypothetical protein [Caudoviricetes sp.]
MIEVLPSEITYGQTFFCRSWFVPISSDRG